MDRGGGRGRSRAGVALSVPRRVAFLRGINLGNRRLTTPELRAHLEACGLANVAIYQASGNAIFTGDDPEPAEVERTIEAYLAEALGYAVDTHVRSLDELVPLTELVGIDAAEADGFKVHVIFLKAPADHATGAALATLETDDDRFRVRGREVVWLRRGGMARAPVSTAELEKALGTSRQTMRTLGTVRRIVKKFGA